MASNKRDIHNNPSTGDVASLDSVRIAYDDLREVNSKLIELKYEKEKNSRLVHIISNDSIIISNYKLLNDNLTKTNKKVSHQRNASLIGFGILLVSTITLLFK